MPIFQLDNTLLFPPVALSKPDGLLAIGGDLSPERLLLAYRSGIFPWYEGAQILWWSPDPRFVLFPGRLKVSKSMQAVINKEMFSFTLNTAFAEVIASCSTTARNGQDGTWITDNMQAAYNILNGHGYAQSAEAWQHGQLVGGLYGVRLGNIFFGESMFSHVSNASKFAFIQFVQHLKNDGVQLIDCQVHTSHLESLGAEMITRKLFLELLQELQ